MKAWGGKTRCMFFPPFPRPALPENRAFDVQWLKTRFWVFVSAAVVMFHKVINQSQKMTSQASATKPFAKQPYCM